ncbi:MAG: helix-turn-helix transcriptional regulator [Ruminococcaceae bacterium]|nr:helix-turn-helix transcriptional regulator [Oscillospiraceae bacterium]
MELMIAQTIRRHRKARNLTQEQLAAALGISSQSVSKWECGDGYPDITLLPNIANFFGITVDELIGNDELGRKEDMGKFWQGYDGLYDNPAEQLEFCKAYYRKYPDNYAVMSRIGAVITRCRMTEEMPLLREVCEKIIDGCTDQFYRQNAAEYMCALCEDAELERWLDLCAPGYESYRGEMLEERLWQQGRRDESREQNAVNSLTLIVHWLNSRGRYIAKPELSVQNNRSYLTFIKEIAGNGEITPAWYGAYGFTLMRLAAGHMGCGDTEDGYAAMEEGMKYYRMWCEIPDGKPLSVGETFGGILLKKNEFRCILPSGKEDYAPFGYYFYRASDLIYDILTRPHGWEWWNSVRETERFQAFIAPAKALCE